MFRCANALRRGAPALVPLPGREGSPRRVSNTARWEVPVSGPQLLSCLRDVLRERLARRRTARGRRRASIAAGCRFQCSFIDVSDGGVPLFKGRAQPRLKGLQMASLASLVRYFWRAGNLVSPGLALAPGPGLVPAQAFGFATASFV